MAMEASASPIGESERVQLKEATGSLLDLTLLESDDGLARSKRIDARWIVSAGFSIEIALVALTILLAGPPASLTAPLAPLALLVLGSVRFSQERLEERVAERVATVSIRSLIAGALLTPAAIMAGAFGSLVGVLAVMIATSSLMTFVIVKLTRSRPKRTLIVGSGPVTVDLADHIVENMSSNLDLIGVLESDRSSAHRHPVVGRPEDLLAIAKATAAEVVIVSFGPFAPEDFVSDIRRCTSALDVYVVPRFFELGRDSDSDLDEINGYPLLKLRSAPTDRPSWRIKRTIDVVASSLLLLIFAPVMGVIALGVRASSPGPILFRQKRIGANEAVFEILKFRTMTVNDDADVTWTVENDPRVTPFGAFLRSSHLDELPQLLNVLSGDMSLVGPRPERPYFVEQFQQEHERYGDRHRVIPGVSGWSQVNGLWGDTSVGARARLDNRYIEDWSLFRDVVIMLRTVPTLFKGRG